MRTFEYDVLGRLKAIQTPSGEDDHWVTYRATEAQPEREYSQAFERVYDYDG